MVVNTDLRKGRMLYACHVMDVQATIHKEGFTDIEIELHHDLTSFFSRADMGSIFGFQEDSLDFDQWDFMSG